MSRLTSDIPFTEIVERIAQISRLASKNDWSRIRGAVNDIYVREIPSKEDWSFLLVSSAITCVEEYDTGTATVNTAGTVVTFGGGFTVDSGFIGRKIHFNDNANVYDITAVSAASVTITPPLAQGTNISGGAFSIYQPIYALAGDFDRFPKNGGLKLYQGGRVTPVPERSLREYYNEVTPFPSTPQYCRLVSQVGTDDTTKVELYPPPSTAIVLPYEYIKRLDPLYDTTAGNIMFLDAGSTVVAGSVGFSRFTEASTGWYFRVNAFGDKEESEWYRVATITHNSSLTLGTAFGLSGATTTGYTLSPIPQIPSKVQAALIYGGVRAILADQNDPTVVLMGSMYNAIIQDARKNYKTRIYNQEVESIAEDFQYRR